VIRSDQKDSPLLGSDPHLLDGTLGADDSLFQQELSQLGLGPRVDRLVRVGLVIGLTGTDGPGTLLGDGVKVVLDDSEEILGSLGDLDVVFRQPDLGLVDRPCRRVGCAEGKDGDTSTLAQSR